MMQNNNTTYTFWLYGWNNTGRFLTTEDLIRCDVTAENIHIESQPVKDIPIQLIRKCDAYTVGGSTFLRHLIRLKMKIGDKSDDIFIFPANPIEPANERNNGKEVNSFTELINSILSNREVTINPSPYYRNIDQKRWADEELDASTSPWVYYHRYRKKPSLVRTILQIIVTFVVLVILVMLLALLADSLGY
jgi:hypothetical protein